MINVTISMDEGHDLHSVKYFGNKGQYRKP